MRFFASKWWWSWFGWECLGVWGLGRPARATSSPLSSASNRSSLIMSFFFPKTSTPHTCCPLLRREHQVHGLERPHV